MHSSACVAATMVAAIASLSSVSAFTLSLSPGLASHRSAVRSSLPLAKSISVPSPQASRRGTRAAAGFTMMAAPQKDIAVGIVGPGLVGGELWKQIEETQDKLKSAGFNVKVAAVSNRKDGEGWMLCKKDGITIKEYEEAFAAEGTGETGDLDKMADFIKEAGGGRAVMFDTTAAEPVSEMYAPWLEKGVHVCTPNKKVGSGPLDRYKRCKKAVADGTAMWGAETTVGAGLPILNILQTDLIQTGDKVVTIEGIFSGTLSYIFNTFKPGDKFSDVIADAKSKGFTEPDPRDDLAGMDVARKVVILARECGLDVELDDVPVKSLVPDALQDWSPKEGEVLADAFVEQMKAFDDEKTELMQEAMDKGQVLRYVGKVDVAAKKVSVELAMYPKTHPFAGTQYADNICCFNTERYVPQPLVVQGPGAGAAVTAAGIYADFLKIAKAL